MEVLKKDILPKVNMFCYGQVESPYGSGQFVGDLRAAFPDDANVVTTEIENKDAIADAIRAFLGKGK
jgi:uncharacterized sporulation protein YeaH/YhbH (DUF444 family)